MLRDVGYWEAVKGRVVDAKTKKPLPDVTVQAYDRDMVIDDFLGEAKTDEKGLFRIEYDQSRYQAVIAVTEGRPDVYLKLSHPDGRKARTEVKYDLEGEMEPTDDPVKGGPDGEMEVCDLGDVEL